MKNMKMKKITCIVLFAFISTLFAGVSDPYKQFGSEVITKVEGVSFTGNGYGFTDYVDFVQSGKDKGIITLNVVGGTDVYLTSVIDKWQPSITDMGQIFDMAKYGYMSANAPDDFSTKAGASFTDSAVAKGTGDTVSVEYFGKDDSSKKATVVGYFLGHFDRSQEIYLFLTPKDEASDETVSTVQLLAPDNESTELETREFGWSDESKGIKLEKTDLAGNTIVNFGLVDKYANSYYGDNWLFTAVYKKTESQTGQPLPGIWTMAAIIACLAVLLKMNKAEREDIAA